MDTNDYNEPSQPLAELAAAIMAFDVGFYPAIKIPYLAAAIQSLNEGDLHRARLAFFNNWDKTESRPEQRQWLIEAGLGPIDRPWT